MSTASTSGDVPQERLLILREIFRGRYLLLAGVMGLALAATSATLVLPWTVGKLLVAIQLEQGYTRWTWIMVGVGLGAAAANALATYLLSRMGHRLICDLRVRSMHHSLGLGLHAARAEGTGNLATRLTADAAAVKSIVDIGPIQLPMSLITLIGTLVIMGLLDWMLLLITLGAFLAAVAVIAVVVVALRRKYVAIQDEVGSLTEHFVAMMESLTVIKAYRAERVVSDQLTVRARQVATFETEASAMEALMVPVINLGQQIALVAIVLGGGARMVSGDLDLGTFVSFLLYLFQLAAPMIMAMSGITTIQAGLVSRKRFDDLFALPSEKLSANTAPGASLLPVDGAPAVRFDQVDFAYGAEPVLRQVDLTVPATGLTAMVGLSGSGKSTVLGLVERFMDPDQGRVEVFGRAATEWPLEELRGQLAYVDQASTLLRDTVRHNLTLGQETPVGDEILLRALRDVGLEEEVTRLPDGLDTVLGGAHDLSGGQRQRLALARASLSDAPLILLDEPSSHLDSINEVRLRRLIDEISQDRAVLVVAHRISTVRHADHVIVMDGGRVTAQGCHDDLMLTSPMYTELVHGQELGLTEAPADVLTGADR
ncbi:ABC transporter ATP-binding protein [Streptomyces lunaelactis]|uniref:ABC transporter ATP-binding protein n=1 Tax=Streptomyces lunaelactis TaxID=1535768 RepID=UPI0015845544|nr:ABC transporter ATP-binding protein [Streptomyces lunaelactis]NUK10050.1 ABC transporter ATP-binding protein [Streptomyces lunaelactis]NUK52467.1 ABC transporter ATP-binding protein [Streptomyces lunaelactis]NUK59712.1 ABC transporter ATP-binding protein [Streptomyces lunaelactis]NUK66204.1 ABC transporter ATP-binding protein [Streptomyces lunaelactis]NUK71315.1 ABC transporter ATP-binding protein [Streptomyces lunaelactis]